MVDRLLALLAAAGSLFKTQRQLARATAGLRGFLPLANRLSAPPALENLALRQQLAMLQQSIKHPWVSWFDRVFWVLFSQSVEGWRNLLQVLHPDTVIRWHRQGFRRYWRWKSRHRSPGRPPISKALRRLIRQMQSENVSWGAPRIHSELLKLGFTISQATVSNYMACHRKPPSQTWRTFLNNHVKDIVAIDFFTVPTATFRLLYVLVVLVHDRRYISYVNVTAHPTAAWTA